MKPFRQTIPAGQSKVFNNPVTFLKVTEMTGGDTLRIIFDDVYEAYLINGRSLQLQSGIATRYQIFNDTEADIFVEFHAGSIIINDGMEITNTVNVQFPSAQPVSVSGTPNVNVTNAPTITGITNTVKTVNDGSGASVFYQSGATTGTEIVSAAANTNGIAIHYGVCQGDGVSNAAKLLYDDNNFFRIQEVQARCLTPVILPAGKSLKCTTESAGTWCHLIYEVL